MLSLIIGLTLSTSTTPPPPTERIPVSETLHGEVFVDEYRWLEALESDSPEVAEWTDLQNAHTRDVLEALPCRSRLTGEFSKLMEIGSVSAPSMRGDLYFYRSRTGTQDQSVLMVREQDLSSLARLD